jgi:hypothetical protein
VGEHVDPEVGQQRLGARAGRHPGRRLPGRGPLEHVPGVVEAVLLHAGEVGVARAGWVSGAFVAPGRRHLLVPLVGALPLAVADDDGDRRAERAPVADAAEQRELVLLEAHARAPPVPEAPAGELGLDLLDRQRQPGRQPLDGDDQPLPMGLTSRQVAQHPDRLRQQSTVPTGHSRQL